MRAGQYQHLWIGVATFDLFSEERDPLSKMREIMARGGSPEEIRPAFEKVANRLREYAPDLVKAVSEAESFDFCLSQRHRDGPLLAEPAHGVASRTLDVIIRMFLHLL